MDPDLLDILRCPLHPEGPRLNLKGSLLICPIDGMGFRVNDGIPDMLIEDALSAEEVEQELATLGAEA